MQGVLAGRQTRRAAQVRPTQAIAFEVRQDQFLQVTDMLGGQTAPMIAFNLHDLAETLSPAHTRLANNALMLRVGDGLYSNRHHRMLTLLEDSVGRHDLLLPACNAERYVEDYGVDGHANCIDNFRRALAERGVDLPPEHYGDPVNFFMHVALKPRGELEVRPPLSTRGDAILLRAHLDLLVVVSACPNDLGPQNAFNPTDILVRVYA